MTSARIIQAGMGIGVSNWRLANTVAALGQIGVVSGTAIDAVLVRRLQDGDLGGHLQFAMKAYPDQAFASGIFEKFFRAGGRAQGEGYKGLPLLTADVPLERQKLLALATFVEVYLAKRGHSGEVGINFLEKVQYPLLPSLYGALLADVDYVFMGAGIPREVPAVLEKLARNEDVEYRLSVSGLGGGEPVKLMFSPRQVLESPPALRRPLFYGIISSTVLALTLCKKANPPVDGLVIEAPSAGGHNAPPRGKLQLNERQEPIYGERDLVDFAAIRELGVPFWVAGSAASPQGLRAALDIGAKGIQVGTAFALCDESGLEESLKTEALQKALSGTMDVFTDPLASPTGFPFKIARIEGTNSEAGVYGERKRRCDLGYLREAYKREDGTLGYRCPAEPVDQYTKKGGALEETVGRKCLCNGLMANIGLGQLSGDEVERPLVTLGDDVKNIGQFVRPGAHGFSAADVVAVLTESRVISE